MDEIYPDRYRLLKEGRPGNGPVVYWMSRDQRARDNWALLFARRKALERKTPLVVVFCLTMNFPGANLRSYMFMLHGLRELQETLQGLGIGFHLLRGEPNETLPGFLRKIKAALLVTDFDPLRIKRKWREKTAGLITLPFYEVDSHNIVPCLRASPKREYAAYTFRPGIKGLLDKFLTEYPKPEPFPYPWLDGESVPLDPLAIRENIRDTSVSEIAWLKPGEKASLSAIEEFIRERLAYYPERRNNPCLKGQSGLSPYFHFGQLSPQRAALEVNKAEVSQKAKDDFLEELIVRRELADNFCYYTRDYDAFTAFPEWARGTLDDHRSDKRRHIYSLNDFENSETGDDLWNACQTDLAKNGKLHGYLRMYWAKKILEWTASPEEALQYAIYLNDRYSLDGRDPNGYTGVSWSIGGVHDRPWPERPVFGKIRYMSYEGCKRKFDVEKYIKGINSGRALSHSAH